LRGCGYAEKEIFVFFSLMTIGWGMSSSERAKQLKAFAKKRELRSQAVVADPSSHAKDRLQRKCIEEIASVILATRDADDDLRDQAVVKALRSQAGEARAQGASENQLGLALEKLRADDRYDAKTWRSANKSLLALVDPASVKNRHSTQFLDLMETICR
jgi:hypothetical protein